MGTSEQRKAAVEKRCQEDGRRDDIEKLACSEQYCVHDLICQTNLLVYDDRAIFYQLEVNKNDLQLSYNF